MPLQWQPVELRLGASMDESTAPFALPSPLLQQLQNARVYKTGAVGKRPGWAGQAAATHSERLIGVGDDLFTLRPHVLSISAAAIALGNVNAGLQRIDEHSGVNGCYSLPEVEVVERTTVMRDAVSADGAGQPASTCPDLAASANTGIVVVAWEATSGTQHVIMAVALDASTRQPVTNARQVSSPLAGNCTVPIVILTTATTFAVLYSRPTSNELRAVPYDASARTWGADVVVAADLNAVGAHYDACELTGASSGWYLMYRNTTPVVKIAKMSGTTVSATTTLTDDVTDACAIYADNAGSNLWLAWYNTTSGVRVGIRNTTTITTVVLGLTTVEAAGLTVARQLTWAPGPGSPLILAWTKDGGIVEPGYRRKVTKYQTVSTLGGLGTKTSIGDVELISKAYSAPNGFTYAAVLYDGSATDPTNVDGLRSVGNQVAFTLQLTETLNSSNGNFLQSWRPAASWARGEAGKARNPSSLSAFRPVLVDGRTEYWFGLAIEFDQIFISAELRGRNGVDLCRQRISDQNATKIFAARIGRNTVFSGGIPTVWDGEALTEYGFLTPPENGFVTDAGAGGSLLVGAYGVQTVWEYRLATGDIVQSAPSVARPTINLTAITLAAASHQLSVAVPALQLTLKFDEASVQRGALCRLYRTEANGTEYFSEGDFSSGAGFAASTRIQANLTATVSQLDLTAITHKKLYTEGDILANQPPPALSFVHTHRNRLFGLVAENRRQVVFTHEYEAGELPGWHPFLVIDVPDEAVALATIDEKLVILCRNGVFLISGNGPDRKGLNNDYDQPFRLNSPHGCKTAESVVSFPEGIIYQAQTGFCLMDRKASITRVGAPVEDTLTLFPYCHASCVVTDQEWIYWSVTNALLLSSSTDGRIVAFDWRHNVWAVDKVRTPSELGPSSAVVTSLAHTKDGTFCTLASGGSIYQHLGFADPGPTWVSTYVKTGMFHLGSNQLFQRARWLTLLGELRGIHQLAVGVTTFDHAASINPAQIFTWVEADFALMQNYALKMHLANQKGAFFQIEIADGPDPGSPSVIGDSAVFVGLVIEMGMKKGVPQMAQASMR